MISNITKFLLLFLSLNFSATAAEKILVVTTIPDLTWLASEIGGPLVDAKPLLKGNENPHYVDAVPEFIRLVAEAKVVCVAGLDLEVGYMPPVLSKSGNAQVQLGGKGYCDPSRMVSVLDKPTGAIDRSMGDVHPTGNPHYYLSPKAMASAAEEIAAALSRVDPLHAENYKKGLNALTANLKKLGEDNKAKIKTLGLSGHPSVIEYHKEFTYFLEYYGISSFGSIEEKPGVPPSAGRIAEIAIAAKAAGVRFVLAADYSPSRTLRKFSDLSDIPVVIVPTMVQPEGKFKTYTELQNHIVSSIVQTLSNHSSKKL